MQKRWFPARAVQQAASVTVARQVLQGSYLIVTLQYSSTTSYQVFYDVQSLFS
jgi:hypothetical protein